MFSIYLVKPDGSRVFQSGANTFEDATDAMGALQAQFPTARFQIL